MQRTLLLTWTVLSAVDALRIDPPQEPEAKVRHVFGPEKRSCRVRGMPRPVCNKTSCRQEGTAQVIGGEVVSSPDAFPFLAWIGDDDGTGLMQFCGGSLIHPRVVLTAGHCLYESAQKNSNIYVRFHLADFAKMPGVARSVATWKRHDGFSSYTLYDDLSLLLLNESVPAEIAPLRLSDGTQPFEHDGDKTVVGWGSVNEECTVYDTLLRRARVPMGPYGPECSSGGSKTLTHVDMFNTTRQLCAGDYSGQMHYPGCGDSGGPLLAMVHLTVLYPGMAVDIGALMEALPQENLLLFLLELLDAKPSLKQALLGRLGVEAQSGDAALERQGLPSAAAAPLAGAATATARAGRAAAAKRKREASGSSHAAAAEPSPEPFKIEGAARAGTACARRCKPGCRSDALLMLSQGVGCSTIAKSLGITKGRVSQIKMESLRDARAGAALELGPEPPACGPMARGSPQLAVAAPASGGSGGGRQAGQARQAAAPLPARQCPAALARDATSTATDT